MYKKPIRFFKSIKESKIKLNKYELANTIIKRLLAISIFGLSIECADFMIHVDLDNRTTKIILASSAMMFLINRTDSFIKSIKS